MATWEELSDYIMEKYSVVSNEGSYLVLKAEFTDGRSQLATVTHVPLEEGAKHWVEIESPIGKLQEVPLVPLLREISSRIFGIGASGDYVTYKHTVLLNDMAVEDLDSPLGMVLSTADNLESHLMGADNL